MATKKKPQIAAQSGKLNAPTSGASIRMYRQGHGDCFLLTLRKDDGTPFHMLIDCGLWSGSEIKQGQTIDKVVADIAQATDNTLDLVVVTHEHMDHVNGFAKKDKTTGNPCFDPIDIKRLWLAWTEDGEDQTANELRERFKDTLIALAAADQKLGDAGHGIDSSKRARLRQLLSFETGDETHDGAIAADRLYNSISGKTPLPDPVMSSMSAAERKAKAVDGITNKRALQYLRERADPKLDFLRPDRGPYVLEGVSDVRVYAFGPPRDPKLLLSLNPTGAEEFRFSMDGVMRGFYAASDVVAGADEARTFPSRWGVSEEQLWADDDAVLRPFLKTAYGESVAANDQSKSADAMRNFFQDHYGQNPGSDWRRIDDDWLASSETFALRLNNEVNNTSLVLAIEFTKTGKVLFFPGDAQRGNWRSWSELEWKVDGRTVTARDLLGRTVFYKAGHHGSHNASLNGTLDDSWPNLSWFALGERAGDFVAVIPAHEDWAIKKQDWHHPLPAIQAALTKKARGRVFRSDRDTVVKPDFVSQEEWAKFERNEHDLYFEYVVLDE